MTVPYPSDGRCWHCNQKRGLRWVVKARIAAWLCSHCQKEQR